MKRNKTINKKRKKNNVKKNQKKPKQTIYDIYQK